MPKCSVCKKEAAYVTTFTIDGTEGKPICDKCLKKRTEKLLKKISSEKVKK